MTGGGLYLFVTPDVNRPGSAASKLWRMSCRFHGRQKTYSIGPYGNGRDGTFSLADARRERDKTEDQPKESKDPSTEKQLDKHSQAAGRSFEQWADEWLAKLCRQGIKRPDVLAFMRSYEADGELETRDRVRLRPKLTPRTSTQHKGSAGIRR